MSDTREAERHLPAQSLRIERKAFFRILHPEPDMMVTAEHVASPSKMITWFAGFQYSTKRCGAEDLGAPLQTSLKGRGPFRIPSFGHYFLSITNCSGDEDFFHPEEDARSLHVGPKNPTVQS
jgi:hypothetical protein